jgi:GAF domain-containing protein
MNGRQVVVRDVRGHPLFRGRAADVLGEASVAAVVSSPIVDLRGKPLGVLSVHHEVPGAPGVSELLKLHDIARRAGILLEQRAA